MAPAPLDPAAPARFVAAAADAIVFVDERGTIVAANAACEALLGYPAGALVGRAVDDLVPVRFGDHAARRAHFLARARPRPMGRGGELSALHADGREIAVDISLSPLTAGDQRLVACVIRDQRGRSHGLDALRVQATALRSAANGIVITDRRGVIVWINPAASAITGYPAAELIGQHTRLLKSGRHDEGFYRELWATVTGGEAWSGTIINRRKDGREYDEQQTIAPVLDEQGEVTHFVAIKQDVSEQRRIQRALEQAHAELAARVAEIQALNRQLAEQAVRDPLTQLHNRRYLAEAWPRELARVVRSGEPVTVALLDLDHFKAINDGHGHAAGDRVLVWLAEVLRRQCRDSDLVCRMGGEEFVAILAGATVEQAGQRAEVWRSHFAAGAPLRCTLSVGLARYRPPEDLEAALARADAALYEAKRAGRDRVACAPG